LNFFSNKLVVILDLPLFDKTNFSSTNGTVI